jgi:hypothetical protein
MRITIAEIVVLALSFQSAVLGRATPQSSNENDGKLNLNMKS